MEIDLRSESPAELEKLNETMIGLLNEAVVEENKARSTRQGPVTLDLQLVGDRPSGQTPRDSLIVRTAAAAVRAAGLTPTFGFGSTDSNIPISLGIPAITIDSGGLGGRAHALDEWIDVEKSASLRGIQIADDPAGAAGT
jgi:di/tripeptidase